jgi:hypothetical protein
MSNFRTIDRPEPTDPDWYLANLRPKCHLVVESNAVDFREALYFIIMMESNAANGSAIPVVYVGQSGSQRIFQIGSMYIALSNPDRDPFAAINELVNAYRVKRVNSNPLMVVATVDPSRHRYNRLTS